MPPKEQRLSKREFEYVFQYGKRISGTYASYISIKTEEMGKIAVAVPKKVIKGATQRNLYKRKIFNNINVVPGYNIIVVASKNIINADMKIFSKEFEKISKLF